MATAFDRWEKDPFFYAAEEVQESTDRMESLYRRWMQEMEVEASGGESDAFVAELRRELHIALGTAKWQLEELDRAVRSSDRALAAGEATVNRHRDFVLAISNTISIAENALKKSSEDKEGGNRLVWVRLDEGERDELALFLSGLHGERENDLSPPSGYIHGVGSRLNGEASVCHTDYSQSPQATGEKMKGHRRVASASADLGEWKISLSTDESSLKLSDETPTFPPPRILSLSELKTMESACKSKWHGNGFRKWKALSHKDMEESVPLRNHPVTRGMHSCIEKSKSFLGDFTNEPSNKQLHGWIGAFQRQIQRSQYQLQYSRSIQMLIWTIVTVLLLGAGFCCMHQTSSGV